MLVHSALGRLRAGVLVLTAAECLRSFMSAVNDGRRGDFEKAKELVERVRGKHGDDAARAGEDGIVALYQIRKESMTGKNQLSGVSQFLRLPLPPSMNSYWRKSPRGMFISKEGKTFRQRVAEIVAEHNAIKFGDARLCLVVRLCMRDRRKSDIDNRLKSLGDALMHAGLFDDDEQIDELFVTRGPIIKGGECVVMVMAQ